MRQSPWTRPIHLLSVPRRSTPFHAIHHLSFVIRCSDFHITPCPFEESRYFIYPRMFALHNLPDGAGLPAPDDAPEEQAVGKSMRVTLPPMQKNSAPMQMTPTTSGESFAWVAWSRPT